MSLRIMRLGLDKMAGLFLVCWTLQIVDADWSDEQHCSVGLIEKQHQTALELMACGGSSI